jgi:hypothetical protein
MLRSPITREPVTDALLAHLRTETRLSGVEYGNIPTDARGVPVRVPYVILDPAGHRYIGGDFGDTFGVVEWGYQVRVVSNATDAADIAAAWVEASLFTRGDDGRYTPRLDVVGQREWDRRPDPQGFRPGDSAEGIVTLVQRFTIRTQRA